MGSEMCIRDSFWDIGNGRLDVTVPATGTLPYEVITAGGSSGRLTDVLAINSVANTGTPTDAAAASANVGQQVMISGAGYSTNATKVNLEAIDSNGLPYILTVAPDSVAADGASLVFTVPAEARTGIASILNGGSGKLVQIVPRVTGIDGGAGRFTAIYGSGFIEGGTTVRFGNTNVVDRGIATDDGIDVRFWDIGNGRLDVTVRATGSLPYEVITAGGSSGRLTDVGAINSAANAGTPTDAAAASANVGQQVTITGAGYTTNATKVSLEAIDQNGQRYIMTVTPDSVAADGTSLVFTVPAEALTGIASLMNGGSGKQLQIVPTLKSGSAVTPGNATSLFGSGFIEGGTTVRFGAADVIDGGPGTSDGLDVRSWDIGNGRIDVTVPPGGSSPVTVLTAGGQSNSIIP